MTEKIITSLPFVKTVYNTVKQIIDTFARQKSAIFQKVVLIEFPRKDIYAMGFLTGRGKGEVQNKTPHDIINVFLPTTPNPTSGYLIMVPKDDVQELEMTVADGMKLIVSGGAVVPHYNSERGTNEFVEVTGSIPASKNGVGQGGSRQVSKAENKRLKQLQWTGSGGGQAIHGTDSDAYGCCDQALTRFTSHPPGGPTAS